MLEEEIDNWKSRCNLITTHSYNYQLDRIVIASESCWISSSSFVRSRDFEWLADENGHMHMDSSKNIKKPEH